MPFEAILKTDQAHPVIILSDSDNGAEAEIYAFGGLLNAYRVKLKDGPVNLVDGFDSVEEAQRNILNGFKSAKLSPFVCRMRDGRFRFDNHDYKIEKYYLGEHAIHGLLFDHLFEVISVTNSEDHAAVRLETRYDGSDKGFPFPYKLQVDWKLERDNKLSVTTTVSHQHAHAIPYTDGWHPYFTIGASVDDCTLQFNSKGQLEYDEALLPTGKMLADDRFEKGLSLRGVELDNSFELAADNAGCIFGNHLLKLHIQPGAGYPILQIYIPSHRKSIAIENLSGPPDNFNNGMQLLVLPPGEEKNFTASYQAEIL